MWRHNLLSFATALSCGFALDTMLTPVELINGEGIAARAVFYLLGMVACAAGVSLLFHTYILLEAYEMFVKKMLAKLGMNINKFKTVYDCASCALAVVMSLVFFGFGRIEGMKPDTAVCALINGWLIGICSKAFERLIEFKDGTGLRGFSCRGAA